MNREPNPILSWIGNFITRCTTVAAFLLIITLLAVTLERM